MHGRGVATEHRRLLGHRSGAATAASEAADRRYREQQPGAPGHTAARGGGDDGHRGRTLLVQPRSAQISSTLSAAGPVSASGRRTSTYDLYSLSSDRASGPYSAPCSWAAAARSLAAPSRFAWARTSDLSRSDGSFRRSRSTSWVQISQAATASPSALLSLDPLEVISHGIPTAAAPIASPPRAATTTALRREPGDGGPGAANGGDAGPATGGPAAPVKGRGGWDDGRGGPGLAGPGGPGGPGALMAYSYHRGGPSSVTACGE